jgi:Peptidase M15
MPVYTVPPAQSATDPILEAAKNFMQSPDYARQFMGNLNEGVSSGQNQPPPAGPGYAGGGMSPAAMSAFEGLSGYYPDLNVTSGYRDPEHNARVGGAKGSQHIHGNAYDLSTAGMSPQEIGMMIDRAQASGFSGIGVYDNSVHFDVGPERAWGPSYHRDSLPSWAAPYVDR